MKKSPDTLNFDGNTAEGTEEEGAGSVPDAPPPEVSPNKQGATSPHKDKIPICLISNASLYDEANTYGLPEKVKESNTKQTN